jgi:hypothetical protein
VHNFKQLGQGSYYTVPKNQRGYSWNRDHVELVFTDLIQADDSNKSHYMGPIIVTKAGSSFKDDDCVTTQQYVLEDGQQRITTFFMIINVLKTRLKELNHNQYIKLTEIIQYKKRGGPPTLRIQNMNPNFNLYLQHLMQNRPKPKSCTIHMKSLEEVYQYIEKFFSEMSEHELLSWSNRIIHQATFVWIDLESENIDKYLAFDTINSRGLPLSEFDKIKNFCILINSKRSLSIEAEDMWFQSIEHLEKYGVGNRSNEDSFISELYSAYHEVAIQQDAVHSSFVAEYGPLLSKSNKTLERKLKKFIKLWPYFAESFGLISCKNRNNHYHQLSKSAMNVLEYLDGMNLTTISRALLSACHMQLNENDFTPIVELCEKYTFRTYGILGFRKDKNSTKIMKLTNKIIHNSKITSQRIQNEISKWIRDYSPIKTCLLKLSDGNAKYNHTNNISGWSQCYYFLYHWEMFNSPKGMPKLSWQNSKNGKVSTQEHIMPQAFNTWWKNKWPNPDVRNRYIHRLGNLVLTEDNSKLSNKSMPQKFKLYSRPNSTNSEKELGTYTSGKVWGKKEIMNHEINMMKFAIKRWGVHKKDKQMTLSLHTNFNPDKVNDINKSISVNKTYE